jgi:hypothetical protein
VEAYFRTGEQVESPWNGRNNFIAKTKGVEMLVRLGDIKKRYENSEEPYIVFQTTKATFEEDVKVADDYIKRIAKQDADVTIPDGYNFSWVSMTQISYGIHIAPLFID